jgi:hypothetical protein
MQRNIFACTFRGDPSKAVPGTDCTSRTSLEFLLTTAHSRPANESHCVGCAPDLSLALAIVELFVVRPTRNVEPLLDSAAIQLKETTMNLIELGTVTTQTQGGPPNRYLDAGQGFKPVP